MTVAIRWVALLASVSIVASACAQPDGASRQWVERPEAPLSARTSAQVFWTGTEIVVMGGTEGAGCPHLEDCSGRVVLRDGAAFDPETNTWRTTAPSPLPLSSVSTVHNGAVYHVVGDPNSPDGFVGFLSYDPPSDRWEELPIPPGPPWRGNLASAGDSLILYASESEDSSLPDLSYNLGQREWTPLPADPIGRSFSRTMIWTDAELVLVAVKTGSQTFAYDAAAYSPSTGSWRSFPSSDIDSSRPAWFGAGGRVVNPTTGVSQGRLGGRPLGGMFDPTAGSWEALPADPDISGRLLGFSGAGTDFVLNENGLILDVAEGRWVAVASPLPVSPDGGTAVLAEAQVAIWTGALADDDSASLGNNLWTWPIRP